MLSSLNLKSSNAIQKQDNKKMRIIIQSLLDHSDSHDFRQPVDWKGMGLTDYPSLVKTPMDLGTVHKRFTQCKYNTIQQFCDQIQLIWDNCKIYNPVNSWIYQTAQKLQRAFRKMSRNYFPDINIPIPLKQQQSKKNSNNTTSMIDDEYQDITYRDKLRFSEQLSFLSSKNLQKVIKQIKLKSPLAYKQTIQGNCQVMVDNLELSQFNQIFAMIKEFNKTITNNAISQNGVQIGNADDDLGKIKGNKKVKQN